MEKVEGGMPGPWREYGLSARSFVPTAANLGDWADVQPLLDALDARPLGNAAELEQWLLDVSELMAGVQEERARRYVAMTADTADPKKAQAWREYTTELQPRLQPRWHALSRRFVECPLRGELPAHYDVHHRLVASQVELFREENVALQVQERELDQRYQELSGAMTVEYDGREQTLQQMARYLQETDRSVRERAWRATVERRLQDRDALDETYLQMITLRREMAEHAGHSSYVSYRFQDLGRFDYGPEQCRQFHRAIEEVVGPVVRRLHEDRRRRLGVDSLRPWDLHVDPEQAAPLRPFADTEELSRKCGRAFRRVHSEFGEWFEAMCQQRWLDLDSRKGKAPGGYQATFDEGRHPFIFMNAVGVHADVTTLFHEGGHAFHGLACRDLDLVIYRHAPIEFAEVASMSMELLALEVLDEFYAGDELRRARREQIERVLGLFPQVARIDAFQHEIYQRADWTAPDLRKLWLRLSERFESGEDWSGLDAERASLWQRVLHLYSVPLYYVEYAIAQIGALQLWCNARRDRDRAIAAYRRALALGGSRPLPELWEAAELRFDFSEQTLRPLIAELEAEHARLA